MFIFVFRTVNTDYFPNNANRLVFSVRSFNVLMIYVTGKVVPVLNNQAMKMRRGAVKRFLPLEPGIVTVLVQVGYGSHNCLQTVAAL
jgi:hypothetical protein